MANNLVPCPKHGAKSMVAFLKAKPEEQKAAKKKHGAAAPAALCTRCAFERVIREWRIPKGQARSLQERLDDSKVWKHPKNLKALARTIFEARLADISKMVAAEFGVTIPENEIKGLWRRSHVAEAAIDGGLEGLLLVLAEDKKFNKFLETARVRQLKTDIELSRSDFVSMVIRRHAGKMGGLTPWRYIVEGPAVEWHLHQVQMGWDEDPVWRRAWEGEDEIEVLEFPALERLVDAIIHHWVINLGRGRVVTVEQAEAAVQSWLKNGGKAMLERATAHQRGLNTERDSKWRIVRQKRADFEAALAADEQVRRVAKKTSKRGQTSRRKRLEAQRRDLLAEANKIAAKGIHPPRDLIMAYQRAVRASATRRQRELALEINAYRQRRSIHTTLVNMAEDIRRKIELIDYVEKVERDRSRSRKRRRTRANTTAKPNRLRKQERKGKAKKRRKAQRNRPSDLLKVARRDYERLAAKNPNDSRLVDMRRYIKMLEDEVWLEQGGGARGS